MKSSVGLKIGAGFALALAILVIIGLVSYRSTSELIETSDWRTHSYEVLDKIASLLSWIKDAETGHRGYIITGKEEYLGPFNAALDAIDRRIHKLRRLTEDNPNQQKTLDTIEPLINREVAELKETVELRKSKGLQPTLHAIQTDKAKLIMDDIRKLIAQMEEEEHKLLKQHDNAARRQASKTISVIVYGIPCAFVLLFLVAFLITRGISRPLKEISGAAEKIASGDLTVKVSSNGRRDEVGTLARTFNEMALSLQEMARLSEQIAAGDLQVKATPRSEKDVLGKAFAAMVGNLRLLTVEITEGLNILGAAASETLASSTQVASGTAETATAVSETAATVEEVKQTAHVSNEKVKHVSETARRVAQVSENGKYAVEESIQGMNRIREQMESIAESIVRLSEQSQAVGEIIATVDDLAEQSNLLAVNASIEAAKAGEQGKGFAVVAQEIKSLAEQSRQATAQVRAILGEIQKATSVAVMATEQGSKAVEAGMKQATQAGDSIRMLAEGITEAAQAATQIAASIEQQLVGMDQVALAMDNIKQASTQNASSTKQVEGTAQNLHRLGEKLKHLVGRYKV